MCVVIQFDSIYAIRNLLLSTTRPKGVSASCEGESVTEYNPAEGGVR